MEDYSKAVIDLLKGNPYILQLLYDDLARPGVKQVGIALKETIELCSLPITLMNEKMKNIFKSNMEEYRERVENIPDDKINEVPPQLGVPLIKRLGYINETELSNKFLSLLTSASHKDHISSVHPSFIQIVDRLSVDEARIIDYIKYMQTIPFINIGMVSESENSYSQFSSFCTGIENKLKLEFPQNIRIYLDNLMSIRIIEESDVESLLDEDRAIYEELPKLYSKDISYCEVSCLYSPIHTGKRTVHTKGHFKITSFGRSFLWACTRDDHKRVSKIYKKGLKVKHPAFGIGEIVYTDQDKYLQIKFENGKDILVTDAKNANLEILTS